MKVQHITHGGTSVVRDTKDINLKTISMLKDFKIGYDSQIIMTEALPFEVKVTATDQGAMFDIMKHGNLSIMNACSFSQEQSRSVIDLVKKVAKAMPGSDVVRIPEMDTFIYTTIINPFVLTSEELHLSGEVELYIYYQLYLSQS